MPLAESIPGGARPLMGRSGGGSANEVALGLKELHPEQIRTVLVPMYVSLDAAATSGYDTYRVPTTHDLVIEEIRAHLAIMDHTSLGGTSEVGGVTILTGAQVHIGNYMDRLAQKANNVLLDLKNTDREQKVIDNHSFCLGSLHPAAGGLPVHFGATPHKVLAGESIRLDVRYADATSTVAAELIKGATQCGIVLVGKLVRVAKS